MARGVEARPDGAFGRERARPPLNRLFGSGAVDGAVRLPVACSAPRDVWVSVQHVVTGHGVVPEITGWKF